MRLPDSPSDDRWHELLTRGWREPGDLDTALARIAETAREGFSADLCVIFAINPVTGRFLPKPGRAGDLWPDEGTEPSLKQPRKQGLARQVLQKGALVVGDITSLPADDASFCRQQGICCFAAVALHTLGDRKPLAVLYLDYRRQRAFDAELERQLRHFAELASRELQSTWFLRRYRWVADTGQRINRRALSEEHLFQELWSRVRRIIDASRCFLLGIYHPEGHLLDLYARIEGVERVQRGRPVDGSMQWLLEEGGLYIKALADETEGAAERVTRLPGVLPWEPQSLIFLPLLMEGRPLGVLSVQHPEPGAFHHEDRHLLELLANHVSVALSNQRLYGQLARLHQAGQTLTRNLDSEKVLQAVVDAIRETTGCDLALLYPYSQASDSFELPPRQSGELMDASVPQPRYAGQSAVARFVLQQPGSLFEEEAGQLARVAGRQGQQKGGFQQREGVRSVAAVPLRVGEEMVGVLFVNYRTPQRFDPGQRHLLEGLAGYAAIAIKNARELGARHRRYVKDLEALREFDRALSRSNDLDELLSTILRLAHGRLADRQQAPDEVAILLYDPELDALVPRATVGGHPDQIGKHTFRVGEDRSLALEAFTKRRTILASDVRDPQWQGKWLDIGAGTLCELDVPLLDGNQAVGVLSLASRTLSAFDRAEIKLMEALAGEAVLAVKKAQAYEETTRALHEEQRRREDEEALIELGKELTVRLEVEELLELILQRAIDNTKATAGVLVLVDAKQGSDLVVKAEIGVDGVALGRRLSQHEGILGLVARTGELVNTDLTDPEWQEIHVPAMDGIKSELAVPLKRGEAIIGVLNVESPEKKTDPRNKSFFSPRNEQVLTGLADLAVIALQNAERFEAAEKRQRKLKALDKVGRAVVEQLDSPDQVLRAVVEHVLQLTGATISNLDRYEDGYWIFRYRAQVTEDGEIEVREPLDLRQPGVEQPPRGIMLDVARNRKAVLVPGDALEAERYRGEPDIHSELAVPLLSSNGELLGVLDVTSTELGAFDEEDKELLELFAQQVVIAIENSRQHAATERSRRRFEALHRTGEQLAQVTDLDDLHEAYGIVIREAEAQFESEVVIRRVDPATRELVRVRSAGKGGPKLFDRIPADDPLNGRVARARKTLIVHEADHPPDDIGPFRRSNPEDHSFVVTPILFRDDYYGNVALSHVQVNYFRDADVKLIEGLAQQLAITIHRLEEARAHQETERRALEAEVMGEIGRQTYEIMHRLGNDLGLVPKWVQGIRSSQAVWDPVDQGRFDKILRQVTMVLDFSNKLGDVLSKQISSKERAPVLEPTPVGRVIEDAVAGLELDDAAGIQLALRIADDAGSIEVDRAMMADALLNLLTNAKESMPAGGTLTVEARRRLDEAIIHIQDTGVGIPKKSLTRIFHLGYTTKPGGSGFGLWSVKRIVAKHGGFIEVESLPGKGTTITLVFPRAEATTSREEDSSSPIPATGAQAARQATTLDAPGNLVAEPAPSPTVERDPRDNDEGRWRILVVEDDAFWREEIAEILAGAGYEVQTVATRPDALKALDEDLFHLLVVDLRLEDHDPSNADGMEFLRALKRQGLNEAFKVVVFTAYGTAHQMREVFVEHGAQDFLRKQEFREEEFLAKVNTIFEQDPRGRSSS